MSISTNFMYRDRCALAVVFAALMVCGVSPLLWAQSSISEPHTVFYGKVLGTASAQNFLITEGQLVWTIQRSDGVSVTLQTSLYPLYNNMYSYRLNVPHSAIALGLSSNVNGIPLPPVPQVHVHAEVKVDGQPAALLGPAGSSFTTEQLLRTATYRMDLGLNRAALDSDGDGMPDWWEDLYGLDKQDPSDATAMLGGDGLSALDAYLRGIDPTRAARSPSLLTEDVIVYLSGTTAILLDTADLDSTAEQQVYTLTRLPYAGTLLLRNDQANPESPDRILSVGSQFTQADLQKGRLVYEHDGSNNAPGSFAIELRDENPDHTADAGSVNLLPYEPADLLSESLGDLELHRLDNYFHAGLGYIILDGGSFRTNGTLSAPSAGLSASALDAYMTAFGPDRPYRITAGSASLASVTGGHGADVLVAGENGGILTGGPGADRFTVQSFGSGVVTITDFSSADADVLDFSRIPAVSGADVHQVLRLTRAGGNHQLQTDLDGDGAGFTNLTVSLSGLSDADDLYTLIESGRLLVGTLQLEPMITIVASQPQASENGPSAGIFTLVRRGSLATDLPVNLLIGGSAVNGVDYESLYSPVVMPAGVASMPLLVSPRADNITEPLEDVRLTVMAGDGYRVGASSQAVVTIEDLMMLVDIRAVQPVAVKESATPGVFMITRRDVVDRDVDVVLTIGGTASNGGDYRTLSTQVRLASGQAEAFLLVEPKTDAVLSGGLETVIISINSDPGYRVGETGRARVSIIERLDTFEAWRAREFPDSMDDPSTFAVSDSGSYGVSHIQRFAFGLDPHHAERSGLPRPLMQDGRLVVTFRKPLRVQGNVVYRVRAFTDLMNPDGTGIPIVPIAPPEGASDPEQVYYGVDKASAADVSSVFSIVELEWTP